MPRKSQPKPKYKHPRPVVGVRLEGDVAALLDAIAAREQRQKSVVVARAIRLYSQAQTGESADFPAVVADRKA